MTKCKTPCLNKCKENNEIQMILRKDLDEHLTEQCVNRAYKCQYCGKKDTYANITDIHDDLCEKKPHPCPNPDCSESMQRTKIKQHLDNDCEYTVISCKYEAIGCDVKMKRKDMRAHEQDDKAHLHQALNTVVKLQDDLQSATENMKKESDDIAVKLRKESNDMAVKLKRESDDMATKESNDMAIKLKRESNDMAVQLRRESNNMAVQLRGEREDMAVQLRGESDDMATKLRKESNDIAIKLKRESNDMAVQLRGEREDMAVKLRRESNNMAVQLRGEREDMAVQLRRESNNMMVQLRRNGSILLFIGFLLLSVYLYHNNNEIRTSIIAVRYRLQASMKEDNKAVQDRLHSMRKKFVIFKIINYEKKKKNNEVFPSQSFYTGIEEYNMRIDVYPNGNGKGEGTHVSVFVYILKGDNDDNLKWPFIGTVKIELLNQLEDKSHHLMTVPFNQEKDAHVGSVWGYPTFIPHSQLSRNPVKNTQYLKDDTLYFRVSVEVSGHKPWLECTLK